MFATLVLKIQNQLVSLIYNLLLANYPCGYLSYKVNIRRQVLAQSNVSRCLKKKKIVSRWITNLSWKASYPKKKKES